MTDEPSIHEHETRISLIEQTCKNLPDNFAHINRKLDKLQTDVTEIKIREAGANGARTALLGAGSGGAVFGLIKLVGMLWNRPE